MIKILELYKNASNTAKMDTVKFIDFINAGVEELRATYGAAYVTENDTGFKAASVDDEISVYPEYKTALCDYALASFAGSAELMSKFYSEAERAYLTVWRRLGAGMRKNRDSW